jgi:hypothetical protein
MTNDLHNSRQTVGGFALVAYANTAVDYPNTAPAASNHSHRHAAQLADYALGSCHTSTLLRQLGLRCRVLPHVLNFFDEMPV